MKAKSLTWIASLVLLAAFAASADAQQPKIENDPVIRKLIADGAIAQVQPKLKYAKGRKVRDPAKLAAMMKRSWELHGHKLKALPKASAAAFSCVDLNWCPPVLNQGQCGSCWAHSGVETAAGAFIKAGWPGFSTTDLTTVLSPQFVLDCGQNGGCDGDDNTTVLAQCKATGIPMTKDYGPYQAQAGQCKSTSGMTMYKIQDWVFVDPGNDGVSGTQKIKDAMAAYGVIGCAVAAGGSDFWNTGQGTCTGNSTSIDHDVLLTAWDDNHDNGDGSKGAWLMQNSWDVTWGTGGRAWMKYGADSIGYTAVVAIAPPSPAPPSAPSITSPLSATATYGSPFSYQITATNAPTTFSASGLPAGLTFVVGGQITGTPTVGGQFPIVITAANTNGAGNATLNLTVTGGPTPPPPPPASSVTITLTGDQVAKVIADSGSVVIRADMTLAEFWQAIGKAVSAPKAMAPKVPAPLPETKEPPLPKTAPKADILKKALDQAEAPKPDPFTATLAAAYAAETDPAKGLNVFTLARVYRLAAQQAMNPNMELAADLNFFVRKQIEAALPMAAIPKVRGAVGSELGMVLPTLITVRLDQDNRQLFRTQFNRVAALLESLS